MIITRTNLATNPSAVSVTGYAAVPGTGGAAALSNQTTMGYSRANFNRVTWSTATTAVSGGVSYTQAGLSADVVYSASVWVRTSLEQRLALKADFRDASNTVVNTVTGAAVVMTAGSWSLVSVTGTAGAAVTNVVLTVQAVTGTSAVNWSAGATLDIDAVMIEASSTVSDYFDGSFTQLGVRVYEWTGAADESTSTEKAYSSEVALAPLTNAPCPRVDVTVTDLVPGDSVVNIWRTADGAREPVRGARGAPVNGSAYFTDYEAPLNRTLSYSVEVLSGAAAADAGTGASTTLTSSTWWIQDPLVPSSAVPLGVRSDGTGYPCLTSAALASLERKAGVQVIPVMGSTRPIAITGQRLAAAGVDFSMFTKAAEATTRLRDLLRQAPILLVREAGGIGDALPGALYTAVPSVVEAPKTVPLGGTLTRWELSGDTVAAPAMNILVPVWTYGDVEAIFSTYQQAQDAKGAKTYLDDLKNPSGA